MSTVISIKELYQVLDKTPLDQNIMLAGKHGVGKSQIITSYYKNKGYKVHTLFLGQMADAGDLIGLPKLIEVDGVPQTVNALPPWFPVDNKPIVLFLDELNRARPEVLQAVMDLALNKTIAGRKLPEGSRVASAVNDGEEYQLTELDPALNDRFNIYNLVPTVPEWLTYAKKKGLDVRVIDFIEHNQEMLMGNTSNRKSDLDKTPSPRSWEKVSDVMKNITGDLTGAMTKLDEKIIAGIVGPEAARSLYSFTGRQDTVTGEDVLYRYDEVKRKITGLQLHERSILNEAIVRALTVLNIVQSQQQAVEDNVYHYIKDLFTDNKQKECRANFAALMRRTDVYKQGIAFIMRIKEVYKMMQDYYKNC